MHVLKYAQSLTQLVLCRDTGQRLLSHVFCQFQLVLGLANVQFLLLRVDWLLAFVRYGTLLLKLGKMSLFAPRQLFLFRLDLRSEVNGLLMTFQNFFFPVKFHCLMLEAVLCTYRNQLNERLTSLEWFSRGLACTSATCRCQCRRSSAPYACCGSQYARATS